MSRSLFPLAALVARCLLFVLPLQLNFPIRAEEAAREDGRKAKELSGDDACVNFPKAASCSVKCHSMDTAP